MTAMDVIRSVDADRPNSIDVGRKVAWLARCDGQIWRQMIATHEGAQHMRPFMGRDETEAEYTEMMIGKPYEEIYEYYLMAQIDLVNGDLDHYTNDMILYNSALDNFARYWHQTHMPRRGPRLRL